MQRYRLAWIAHHRDAHEAAVAGDPACRIEIDPTGTGLGLVVGDNEPYSVTDASDYTIPVHGEQRDLHHVALKIRQDLITDEAGQRMWAALLARLLPQAYQRLT
jgi:predicted N-formylglutamate amidohydrolase